jgi:hypothetical protein
MKIHKSIGILVLMIIADYASAQCTAVASSSKVICRHQYDTVRLGGSPTAFGGVAPYRYEWRVIGGASYIEEVLDNPYIANPLAKFKSSTALLRLIVTDSLNNQCFDTVHLFQTNVIASDMINRDQIWKGDSMRLSANIGLSTIDYAPLTYAWRPSTALQDSTLLRTYAKPIETITYYLTITNTVGCTFHDYYNIIVTERPKEPKDLPEIVDEWTVKLKSNTKVAVINPPKSFANVFYISIMDMRGIEHIIKERAIGETEIDASFLQPGIYTVIIRWVDDSVLHYKKIIIER